MIEFIKKILSRNSQSSMRLGFLAVTFTFILISIAFTITCISTGKLDLLLNALTYVWIPALTIFTGGKWLQKKEEIKEEQK